MLNETYNGEENNVKADIEQIEKAKKGKTTGIGALIGAGAIAVGVGVKKIIEKLDTPDFIKLIKYLKKKLKK